MKMNLEVKYDNAVDNYIIVRSLSPEYNKLYNDNGFFYSYCPPRVIHNSVVVPSKTELTDHDIQIIKNTQNEFVADTLFNYNLDFNPQVPENIEELSNEILKHKQEIETSLHEALPTIEDTNPSLSTDNINLTIYISKYGTSASFYNNQIDNNITVILRNDSPLSEIIFGLVNIFFARLYGNPQNNTSPYLWHEKQLIIDFLIKHTKLARVFDKFNSNVLNNRNSIPDISQAKIHNEIQKEYDIYKQRGFFKVKKIIEFENRQIFNLSITETEILSKLISNTAEIVTYDELANMIWKEDSYEKFSIQAINKHIQRIRRVLIENGINKQVIFSVRNEGYTFIN